MRQKEVSGYINFFFKLKKIVYLFVCLGGKRSETKSTEGEQKRQVVKRTLKPVAPGAVVPHTNVCGP